MVDDEELARRSGKGDCGAFEELVERHQRYVFNLCLRTLGDYDLAAETAQEVFLRVWRSLGSFRGEARFTTWLYTVAHNLCMNRLSSLNRENRHRVGDEETVDLSLLPSREEDPAEVYEKEEWRGRIHRLIDQLPPRYRIVITLFYLQELSYQEIARVTDQPIGTVKTHLFRAKEMLRRAMEDEMPREIAATNGIRGGSPAGAPGAAAGGTPGLLRRLPVGARELAPPGGRAPVVPNGAGAG